MREEKHTVFPEQDAEDVALASRGDHEAFERLYRDNVSRIHSLAVRMTDLDQAEDLTQEIFIRAWQKLDTFGGRSRFSTWLYRVAINVILARRVSLSKERSRYLDPEKILERLPARSASSDLRMDFESAIRTLPGGAREVLVMHDVEGFKHQEIADMLEISAGTSKSQLHRARMLLRRRLVR